ncbi:hypothetical protein KVH31_22855 [Streptomyces olivaceus]|uniref:hypothetical protein n=1 Tax=Streptomyces olivaceus TaxID=47716 RepID=UPI001CCEE6F3|nr:hypothetical protein [Streptomyces olivaceus]MBZ6209337.1 hypothetical protein [Streptomyces olivaceus]
MGDDHDLLLLHGLDHLFADPAGISSPEEQRAVLLGDGGVHLAAEQLSLGRAGVEVDRSGDRAGDEL